AYRQQWIPERDVAGREQRAGERFQRLDRVDIAGLELVAHVRKRYFDRADRGRIDPVLLEPIEGGDVDHRADRRRRDRLALEVRRTIDRRILANDHLGGGITLDLDRLAGAGHDVEPPRYRLEEISGSGGCEFELPSDGAGQQRKILNRGQRDRKAVL